MAVDLRGISGRLEFNSAAEGKQLKQVADSYSKDPSQSNKEALSQELWRINQTLRDTPLHDWAVSQGKAVPPNDRRSIYDAYKSAGGSDLVDIKKDTQGIEYLDLKNPFAPADKVSDKTGRSLFVTYEDPLMSINPGAASAYSDSGAFTETMVALAASNPKAIAKMIKDNGDGTVKITFPGAPEEPIKISAHPDEPAGQPDKDGGIIGQEEWRGTWPAALKQAYRTYMQEHYPQLKSLDETKFWQRDHDMGAENEAYRLLTGQNVQEDTVYRHFAREPVSTFARRLDNATANSDPTLFYFEDKNEYSAVWGYDGKDRYVQWGKRWPNLTPLPGVTDDFFYAARDK